MCAQGRRAHEHVTLATTKGLESRDVLRDKQKFQPAELRSADFTSAGRDACRITRSCTENQFLSTIRNNERA